MPESQNVTEKPENDSANTAGAVVKPGAAAGVVDATDKDNQPKVVAGSTSGGRKRSPLQKILSHLNIYFLLFMFLLVVAGVAVFVSYQTSKKEADTTEKEVKVQSLTDEQLKAVQSSSTKVGDPKSILNIESSAIFAGKVLVKDSLEVAGTIKVGGPLALSGITVGGTSQFDIVTANTLQLSGNAIFQGQVSIQKTLAVSGGATFGGTISAPQLNIDNLQINKDLVISHHVVAGGSTPAISFGTALGGGGTASISGTDTAGTITINTGANPPVGCFATINFTQKFNSTPHIALSPVGSEAAGLNYYINRSSSSMSVCTTSSASSGKTFFFDYVAFD